MRHIGEIMKDLGFNSEAPEETQKSFLKHLMKAAEQSQQHIEKQAECSKGEQLSFSLDKLEARPKEPTKKRVS